MPRSLEQKYSNFLNAMFQDFGKKILVRSLEKKYSNFLHTMFQDLGKKKENLGKIMVRSCGECFLKRSWQDPIKIW